MNSFKALPLDCKLYKDKDFYVFCSVYSHPEIHSRGSTSIYGMNRRMNKVLSEYYCKVNWVTTD